MNYLTNYYKNLSEQLHVKVNYLKHLLETSGSPGDKVTGAKMSKEEKRALIAKQLGEINAQRQKAGEKPFENMDAYRAHNIEQNKKRRSAREDQTRSRIETWANSPEGQANIADRTSGY
jgi:hypothetical protein